MQTKQFPDATPEERAKLLEDNAYAVELEDVKRDFTPLELEQKKESLMQLSITKTEKEDELAEVKKPLEAAIKNAKEEIKIVSRELKKKSYVSNEKVFYFDDQDGKSMHAYDIEGNLLFSRRLKPSERQTSVVTMAAKEGSNG